MLGHVVLAHAVLAHAVHAVLAHGALAHVILPLAWVTQHAALVIGGCCQLTMHMVLCWRLT